MHELVILGAGTAGTAAANRLRTAIPERELAITIVDQNDVHQYQPGFLFRVFGVYPAKRLVRPRHAQLRGGIELTLACVERVDVSAKQVVLADGRKVAYDTLVIATGVSPRPDLVPGMLGPEFGRSVHHFYDRAGAEKLREALLGFTGGRVVVHICEMPIKCPVAPLEFAFLMDDWLRRRGVRDKSTVTFVTPLDGAFTRPIASRELDRLLADRRVDIVTDFVIEELVGDAHQIVSFDGRRVEFDLLVTVPPELGPDYVARSGIGDEMNLVPCDPHTLAATGIDGVFVLGDAGDLPTSKSGAVAAFTAEVFAENFLSAWHGRPARRRFDGHAHCFLETGHGKATLLDFNYDTEPMTGKYPLPLIGPLPLLRESRLSHFCKLWFDWVYWHVLLPGRQLPLPTDMTTAGKNVPMERPKVRR